MNRELKLTLGLELKDGDWWVAVRLTDGIELATLRHRLDPKDLPERPSGAFVAKVRNDLMLCLRKVTGEYLSTSIINRLIDRAATPEPERKPEPAAQKTRRQVLLSQLKQHGEWLNAQVTAGVHDHLAITGIRKRARDVLVEAVLPPETGEGAAGHHIGATVSAVGRVFRGLDGLERVSDETS